MERLKIKRLFQQLQKQKMQLFPQPSQHLDAPESHGVYVIRGPNGDVMHVGRTHRGQSGLKQRLKNHLAGQSSFVDVHLHGKGSRLRDGFTFQYLEVKDDRERALLEHFATAWHCPKHLGLGAHRSKG